MPILKENFMQKTPNIRSVIQHIYALLQLFIMGNFILRKYERIAVILFGWVYEKAKDTFDPLAKHMRNANMGILVKTWISLSFMTALLVFIATLGIAYAIDYFFVIDPFHFFVLSASLCLLTVSVTLFLFYIYPLQKESERKKSIENNLPFATIHMAAVASAGIPIDYMFSLLANFPEYGEISTDAKMIMRNIKTFGMNYVDALKDVEEKTPSPQFKSLLGGIISTVQSGGDLTTYLNSMAQKAVFEYKIKRERYIKTLSTYADLYTVLLVAAPLMMISILATMSIIGGKIMGLTIEELMSLITWVVLPILNTIFILFIHFTYPNI